MKNHLKYRLQYSKQNKNCPFRFHADFPMVSTASTSSHSLLAYLQYVCIYNLYVSFCAEFSEIDDTTKIDWKRIYQNSLTLKNVCWLFQSVNKAECSPNSDAEDLVCLLNVSHKL